MADRYPLIANPDTKQIEELAAFDNLNLTNNGIVGATTITSNQFIGDLAGTATTSTFLANASNIITGVINPSRLRGTYDIGVTTSLYLQNAANVLSGTLPRGRLSGEYDIDITGTASTSNSLSNASNITGGIVPSSRLSGVYNIDITGTAFSSVGAALSLSINRQVDNQVQFLTYAKDYDRDTSAFVNPEGLVYNPGLNYVGVGTDDPLANLDVRGTLRNVGLTTTNNLFATVAIIPSLEGVTSIDDVTKNTIEVSLGLDVLNDLTVVGLSTFDDVKVLNQTDLNTLNVTGISTQANANITNLTASRANITGVTTVSSVSVGSTQVLSSSRQLRNLTGIDSTTAAAFRADLGLNALTSINVTGLSTFQDVSVVGVTSLTNVTVSGGATFQTVNANTFLGSGAQLSGIVTTIIPGIGVTINPGNGKGSVRIDAYKPIGKTIFVTQSGNDSNSGLTENDSKATIKAAAEIALSGDTIKVFPGYYIENNPIILQKNVAVEGTELRNCLISPLNSDKDLFHVNNAVHITDLSFVGSDSTNGAAVIAFQPLVGVSSNRFFDAARLIRMNLDYIANEAVGYITSTDYKSPAFVVPTGDSTDCSDDIKDIFKAICYDITRGGNSKCVGAGKSYYNGNTLQHITGTDVNGYSVKEATIDAIKYAVGIAFSCVNNVSWDKNYQNKFTQVKDLGILPDPQTGSNKDIASCANVLSAVHTCAGIVTTIIGAGTTILGVGINTTYPGNAGAGTTIPNHPSFSPGVGPILQGPYIRNCTNFIPKSIGMKVDGFAAEPGDQDDVGVTGSMSVDSYTQYNQGGIGVSITNGAYAQLVSIFTICCDTAIYTESGGQCDITNSNSSFGINGLVSIGVGNNNTKSIYTLTGTASTIAPVGQNSVTISGIGSYRPYDGQVVYFDKLYYSIQEIEVTNGGSGYTAVPRVTIDAPTGPNGITAQATATIENGRVTSITVVTAGNQYSTTPNVTIQAPDLGTVATAVVSRIDPIYYRISESTLPSAGISTITLAQNLNNTVSTGTTAYFSRLSLQLASSHAFEFIGSGTEILKAKPALGGVTIQENEIVKLDGGDVVYTSTDQAGNFRIGDGVTINQATGAVSGRDFTKALFTTMTPFILALS
jgi:hypothetical protein